MRFYHDWKLMYKILFAAVVPFVVAVVMSVPFVSYKAVYNFQLKAKEYSEELAYSTMLEVRSELDKISNDTRTLSKALEGTIEVEAKQREKVIVSMIKNVAESNDSMFGIWAIMDVPGSHASDESDHYHDVKGRFFPYWVRNADHTVSLVHTSLLDEESYSNYHEKVKAANKSLIFPPLIKTHNGEKKMISVISVPVYERGEIFGTVAVEIDYSRLQKYIDDLIGYGISEAALINKEDMFILHTNHERVGEKFDPVKYGFDKAKKLIDSGQFYMELASRDGSDNNDIYRIFAPITLENGDNSFVIFLEMPLDKVRTEVYQLTSKIMVIVFLCMMIGISVSIVTAKNISDPIRAITTALEKISDGLVDTPVPEAKNNDEIGLMTRSAHVFQSNTKELILAKQVAEDANKSKTEFLANMSHELRTPMHAMLSYSSLGLEKIEDKESKLFKYFSNIHSSGERLLKLVNNLLDLSKLEAGKMEFNFADTSFDSVVSQVKNELQSLLMERKISLKIHSHSENLKILIDAEKIMQVLINILSNAIKFSPDGSVVKLEIFDDVVAGNDVLKIVITDQGVGVPESELESIFDKFIQSTKTNKGSGGTGLGLSIAKIIIEEHKGKIWAANSPQGGAVMSFYIPRNSNSIQEA
jgi:signal transduction histidine kinase